MEGTQGGIGMEGTKSVGWMYVCMCGVARSMSMSMRRIDDERAKPQSIKVQNFNVTATSNLRLTGSQTSIIVTSTYRFLAERKARSWEEVERSKCWC